MSGSGLAGAVLYPSRLEVGRLECRLSSSSPPISVSREEPQESPVVGDFANRRARVPLQEEGEGAGTASGRAVEPPPTVIKSPVR